MLTQEKRKLTAIGNIDAFHQALEKLAIGGQLTEEEKSYLLSASILLQKEYERDRRFSSYGDFAYYLVLKYSLLTQDYRPLFDVSVNLGFYPIAKTILDHDLLDELPINNAIIGLSLNQFENVENYVETLQQFERSKAFLSNQSLEKSYLAPTSYGKSSLIVQAIRNYDEPELKIVVVVPTKSLLMQTYKLIRGAALGKKIIMHDEMYNGESNFIAVFTQERALRLLQRREISYDVLFIDEAHNILKMDSRSILLSRLISKNRELNLNQKVIYLSPLIDGIQSIRVDSNQSITPFVIDQNIKEPDYFEYRLDRETYRYNRFINRFFQTGTPTTMLGYIISNSKSKNFLYNLRPVRIEELSKELANVLPDIVGSAEIEEIQGILREQVHGQFYMIDLLKRGIVYLHGKLPDLIKEYLEYKFKGVSELKFLIANSVILEGMNLPIDNLFIMNTRGLYGKELTNLIGRVNRLNLIFDQNSEQLQKLNPSIHFVNSDKYNRLDSNMKNKMELLRNRSFVDKIENPTLESFDIETLPASKKNDQNFRDKVNEIQENETFLSSNQQNVNGKLKQYVIESGIIDFYLAEDDVTSTLKNIIEEIQTENQTEDPTEGMSTWQSLTMLQKINRLFLEPFENLADYEVKRLKFSEAQRYYEYFILVRRKLALRDNVTAQFGFFQERVLSDQPRLYFGPSYGEIAYDDGRFNKTFIDLSQKSDQELVNLAIVKLKMEEDFVSFKINKFIVMLFDYDLISQDDYNLYIYGTTDEARIALTKFGLNISLINRLSDDNQLQNLRLDPFNNLTASAEFLQFLSSVDDFYRFEVNRYLT
jgi:hypothetical protein